MFTEPVPSCPNCQSADKTFKVSLLYIESSAWLNHQNVEPTSMLNQVMNEYLPDPINRAAQDKFVSRMKGLLAPPAGEKQVLRQIHPDGMVIFFILISIVILVLAFRSQPESVPIIFVLLAAGFTMYLISRRFLVSRYNMRRKQGQDEIARIEKAISRWMRTYFCSRDQCVFDPVTGQHASLEHVKEFFSAE